MSKELEKAVDILKEILELPKGKNETLINLGIRIGINAIKLELTGKRIKETGDKIDELQREIEVLNEATEKLSQEKQGL